MGVTSKNPRTATACLCLLFVGFFVALGLVAGSFKTIQPTEYGLKVSTISKEVDAARVYTSGRYFLGLGRSFIIYPRTIQNIAFAYGGDSAPLDIRLSSGSVSVEMSLQFSLKYEELYELYRDYGTNYRSRFIYSASSAINNGLTAAFNVTDFYRNRAGVKSVALTVLRNAFAAQHADVLDVQIKSISLKVENENQIIAKLVSLQEQETALNLKAKNAIDTDALVLVGQINQEIELLETNQTQIAAVLTETSNAQAKQIRMNAASKAYKSFNTILGFNNTDLMKFLKIKQIKNAPARATLLTGYDDILSLINK